MQICILMGTYNGSAYLAEQLLSIENQTYNNWRLIISDDGSTDATLAIVESFQQKWGRDRLEIRKGPKNGFSKNFLSLVCDPTIKADFYAFSDQDDVWMENKLSIALAYFKSENNSSLPRVYCGRTCLVDELLNPIGYSCLFALPCSFRNALVQSIAGGNTMVFNQSAKEFLEKAGLLNVVSHDWWIYQLIQGVGGVVYYDPEPTIFYRQHDASLVGSNKSVMAKLERLFYTINGRFKEWNTTNYLALLTVDYLLTKENQNILATFDKLRQGALKDRVRLFEVCGLYRQTWQSTISLWFAAIINKI